MKAFRSPTFSERLDTAMTAKKAALERFGARTAANNPGVVERRAARPMAAAAGPKVARAIRFAARKARKP